MKNPCENCIIKMICSIVCPQKRNYEKLIKRGYTNHFKMIKNGQEQYRAKFNYYADLLDKHRMDLMKITSRRDTLFFTPSSRVPK